jgi:hypothetical protein
MFQSVCCVGFRAAMANARRTPLFDRTLDLFISMEDLIDEQAVVHDGNLKISGSFVAPALCTLITGDLEVSDFVDLRRDGGYERGLFIVLGALRCRDFISEYGCHTFVDGDLEAEQSILNGFSDSTLTVTGALKTRLFIGADVWALVGAGAVIEYGEGYCLPIGYCDAARQAIWPQNDEDETAAVIRVDPNAERFKFDAETFAELVRAGMPVFK